MQHVYSQPDCVCDACLGLRMVKKQNWLNLWRETYVSEPDLSFYVRYERVEALILAAASQSEPATPRPPQPTTVIPARPTQPEQRRAETYDEYVERAIRQLTEGRVEPQPARPAQKVEPKVEPPKPEPKDRFELIELD